MILFYRITEMPNRCNMANPVIVAAAVKIFVIKPPLLGFVHIERCDE